MDFSYTERVDFSYTEREEGFPLFALRFRIAGGATEIQKNIIGERLLGLPKG